MDRTPSPNLDPPGLLASLQAAAGQPRLTWYGAGAERVELSGAVLANWVIKTANLLIDECDATPGERIVIDMPQHWRTVVWCLAVWIDGASAVIGSPGAAATAAPSSGRGGAFQVAVTDTPAPAASHLQIAVGLPALARAFGASLPPGAIDGTSVMTWPDALGYTVAPGASDVAVTWQQSPAQAPDDAVTWPAVPYGELVSAWRAVPGSEPGPLRYAVAYDDSRDAAALWRFVATVCAVWAAGGSVVLVPSPHAAEAVLEAERAQLLP